MHPKMTAPRSPRDRSVRSARGSGHPRSNKGHIATYNEGLLEWAEGGYSVLLDADDQLTPGLVAPGGRPARRASRGRLRLWSSAALPAREPLPPARTTSRGWSVWPGHWWLKRRFKEANGCITTPEVVVRTSLQNQVGGYDPRLPHTGDIEMWMRLAAHADVGYVRGADQAFYRVHDQNMSKSRDHLVNLRQRRLAYEILLERYGDKIPDADQLSAAVHRKLAEEALRIAARAYDRRNIEHTPVEDLAAFAHDCWPQADRLPAYRGLQLRRRVGPQVMPYLQPLILTAAVRRARNWLWWESWKRRGL